MKHLIYLTTLTFLAGAAHAQTAATAPATLLVEAEDFQFRGDWAKNSDSSALGGAFLMTQGADSDAMTVVSLAQGGTYNVWVRARDYATEPGSRRYKVALDGALFTPEFGAHGTAGWKWEKAGARELATGDHVLALHDTARFYGRCDAILLTTGDLDPNAQTRSALDAKRVAPKSIEAQLVAPFAPVAELTGPTREVAKLENQKLRIRFLSGLDSAGKTQVVRETAIKEGANWRVVPANQEKLWLQFAPQTEIATASMLLAWNTPHNAAPKTAFEVAGKTYQTAESGNNPFWAAPAQALVPRAVRQNGAQNVEVNFETPDGTKATGRWELSPNASDAQFALQMTAPQNGFYSVGFAPFGQWSREQVQYNLLPPLFQFQRLPQSPVLIGSNATPQPLALVQVAPDGTPMTLGVAADPAKLPFEWATPTNAVYGFSLLNAQKEVQPTIFAPVLGTPRSKFEAGAPISLSWRVISQSGDWENALEYASQNIFGVTDYRKPYGATLSDAAFNMIGLIKSDFASGWDAKLKGFINIEAKNIASQASPLTVVSAAILTRDEELYRTRALPTIEYTLSRPGAHFGTAVPDTQPAYINEAGTKIKVPGDSYGMAYWQGLDELLGHANPWIADIALPGGQPRYHTAYSAMPKWSETLAFYRLKPDAATLKQVVTEADAWLQSDIYGRKTSDLGLSPFYNMSFYPYWWDLLDLYELTGDKKYLNAAQVGAFNTIAGLWSHPRVPEGNITIHAGGEFTGDFHEWWRGDQPYRLGYPRVKGDTPEKQVPAWLVAQMGLGLEQPSTYWGSGKGNMRNIMMEAWAPNLLRLYRYTGREIFRTYARNGILSRWGNYPGYYMTGYTDQQLSPQYPYKGPDVTSLYYHHIPAQLAFTLDFLVTEAETRAQGKIAFPWVKQQGYVWFSNRVYGGESGTVFGDKSARLWLDPKVARAQSSAINTILARGDSRVWMILMNEADDAATAPLVLDKTALGLIGNDYTITDATGKTTAAQLGPNPSVTVPAKGLVALSFPAQTETQTPIPPLQNGRASQKLDGDWGTLEAFRIRSPFAKDSLYVVLTGRPKDGARATLQIEGMAPIESQSYPFEFSVYPIAMNKAVSFTVQTTGADGKVGASKPITLGGTP